MNVAKPLVRVFESQRILAWIIVKFQRTGGSIMRLLAYFQGFAGQLEVMVAVGIFARAEFDRLLPTGDDALAVTEAAVVVQNLTSARAVRDCAVRITEHQRVLVFAVLEEIEDAFLLH